MKLRKGFTLVELLIVIVIIGILAAAMLLSSGSATAAAEASNIVSDLRSMKAAALMFLADSMDAAGLTAAITASDVGLLVPYMDNPSKFTNGAYNFEVVSTVGATSWWVSYSLSVGNKTATVAEKLATRAASVGIYNTTQADTSVLFTKTDKTAYMIAR